MLKACRIFLGFSVGAFLTAALLSSPASAQLVAPETDELFKVSFTASSGQSVTLTAKSDSDEVIRECALPCTFDRRGHQKLNIVFRGDGLRAIALPLTFDGGDYLPRYYSMWLPPKKPDYNIFDEPRPIMRTPPQMPQRANQSGFCRLQFDISPSGTPKNIKAYECAHSMFKKPSISTLKKWRYFPQIIDGKAVEQKGVKTKISYILTDEAGNVYDYYGGFGPVE